MATLILQPSETDPTNRDTFIAGAIFANTNFGTWPELNIGTQTALKGQQAHFRAILRFDLTALIGATITDATLTLTFSYGGSLTNEIFTIHRLTQPNWTELGATWGRYNGSDYWAVAGGDFVSAPAQSVLLPTVQDLVFDDMKALVEDAIKLRGGILDVLIKGASTSGYQMLELYASGEATPSNRPTLVVNYELPVWCVESGDSPEYIVETYDEAC